MKAAGRSCTICASSIIVSRIVASFVSIVAIDSVLPFPPRRDGRRPPARVTSVQWTWRRAGYGGARDATGPREGEGVAAATEMGTIDGTALQSDCFATPWT